MSLLAAGNAKEFLSEPAPSALKAKSPSPQHVRLDFSCENQSEPFTVSSKSFGQQYASLYFVRLNLLRSSVEEKARELWSKESVVFVSRILDVQPQVDTVILGTLYKHMKLKPSIMDEYSTEKAVVPGESQKFVADDDYLVLEDETGRVRLLAGPETAESFKVGRLVTGMVVAVRGMEMANGDFSVKDFCFPGIKVPPALPKAESMQVEGSPSSQAPLIALVSGLRVGSTAHDSVRLQVLVDYLTGLVGSAEEQKFVSRICRLVVAGDSVCPPEESKVLAKGSFRNANVTARQQHSLAAVVREVDVLIAQLCSSLAVDIMPGDQDPTNFSLPQQPLHPALFPLSSRYSSFRSVTNPYSFTAPSSGLRVLGTSGQNVDDIEKFSSGLSRLDILSDLVAARHIAPTCPDTLCCYPFVDNDPFVITDTPHVVFAGNQPEFSQSTYVDPVSKAAVKLLTIPSFQETGTLVLLDTETLECFPITFSATLMR